MDRERPSAKFWDRIAKRYARQPVADEAAYQRKLEITRSYFEPHMDVLEFGCGTGSTAIVHAPHVRRIDAIDISSGMVDIARGKAKEAGLENVHFEQATLEEVTAADESKDMVLGLSILHLLDDREQALGKVFALLKPGGRFISSTACLADSHAWLKPLVFVGSRLGLLPSVWFFSRSELEQELIGQGFELEQTWQPGKRKAVFIVARKPG